MPLPSPHCHIRKSHLAEWNRHRNAPTGLSSPPLQQGEQERGSWRGRERVEVGTQGWHRLQKHLNVKALGVQGPDHSCQLPGLCMEGGSRHQDLLVTDNHKALTKAKLHRRAHT